MAKKEMESKSMEKSEEKKDLNQDKKMIKKAFKEHDKQEHPGKHTKIVLKKGGTTEIPPLVGRFVSKEPSPANFA